MQKTPVSFIATVVLIVYTLWLSSCASYFKRKECEKTNWFEHGTQVAMSGQRLDSDNLIKECQAAEGKVGFGDADNGFKIGMARYCTPENVFAVGKSGKHFSYDMCDGESLAKMKRQYSEGVKVFCQVDNGYRYGTSGGIYEKVCPDALERAWLPEYRRGRKIYLSQVLVQKQSALQSLEQRRSSLDFRRQQLDFEMERLRMQPAPQITSVDPLTGALRTEADHTLASEQESQISSLNSQISSVDLDIHSNESAQDSLNSEITTINQEILTL